MIKNDPQFKDYFISAIEDNLQYDGKKIIVFEQGICDLKTFMEYKYKS